MGKNTVSLGIEGLDAVLGGGIPRGSLIILAGNPGTGKTAFSARFLYSGALKGEKGIYVSFCESREAFMENMLGFGYDFEKLEQEGLFRYMDMLTVKEEGVSTLLNMIISEVEDYGAQRLVLDSFSAMAQAFKEPIDARIILHTILGKIIRSLSCTTLLIEEVPYGSARIGLGIEEFVSDGVIRLKTSEVNGYRIRELEILKLRGVKLKESRLVYTLEEGFKAFAPNEAKPYEGLSPFKPIPDQQGKYSTGSEFLDEVLGGGLPKGSVTLLEVDAKIATQNYQLLLSPIVANFVSQGRGVFMLPSGGIDAEKICSQAELYRLKWECERYLRLIVPQQLFPVKASGNELTISGEDWAADLTKIADASQRVKAETGNPNLWMIGVDTLANLYGEADCLEILNLIAALTRLDGGAAVYILKAGYGDLALKLSATADIHLRMTRKNGTPLLYGVKPRTGLHAVEADDAKGYPIAKLTPIL